ncbi:hypothetical protein [Massilia sp. MS-15]|uniref:hypothetical protein n=1 Tax=Massilia sp. MS-15 TaxID=2878200 RepID=UPI001CD527EA|nr:hypothetical protein [Massilia sp. MS-15]MCA1247168.1 hypothetical protein [Massilia sp. MS-15]
MELRIRLQGFYSPGDERRFFDGLLGLAGVAGCRGEGRDLLVALDLRRLNRDAMRELVALLWRYRIGLAPLRALAGKARFAWLDDPRAYWHAAMFGAGAASGAG